ncbi:MAG: glycosyltransferase [archaeon]
MGVYFLTLYFSIFWLLVLFEEEEPEKKKELKKYPKFSVLIPAFNEQRTILGTIESAANLDYPKDKLEIIVVNDGSKDNTQKIVEEYIKTHQTFTKIKLINQENKGKGAALNVALKKATGEFFACLDADSFIESNALQIMLPFFENETVGAVCPMMKIKNPKTLLQKMQWYEYMVNFFFKKLNAKLDCVHVTPGPFSTYRTKLIKDLGGYDENNLTEDLELAIRLQKHNHKIVQTLDTTAYTIGPNTLRGLFKQRNRWYKGSFYNTLRYRKLLFNKKYGDFGIIRMPTLLISGGLSIVIFFLLLRTLFRTMVSWTSKLVAVNFDIPTILSRVSFNFDILSINFTALAIFLFVITLGLFVLVYSHKFLNERLLNFSRSFISLISYLSIYSFFITIVWVTIAFELLIGKKQKW